MPEKKRFGLRYSFRGLIVAWQEEKNFRIQIVLGFLTLGLGWFLEISTVEWLFVVGVIGLVLAAEVFNTALEELCDKFKTDPDPHIAKIKDLAAAAVLVTSSTAFVVGVIIFGPHLLGFF